MLVFFVERVYGLIVTGSLAGWKSSFNVVAREYNSPVKLFPIRNEEEPCYSV